MKLERMMIVAMVILAICIELMAREGRTPVHVWIDPRTGCHYLYTDGGPITPRAKGDFGGHLCQLVTK
jgi:hypothetical protein